MNLNGFNFLCYTIAILFITVVVLKVILAFREAYVEQKKHKEADIDYKKFYEQSQKDRRKTNNPS